MDLRNEMEISSFKYEKLNSVYVGLLTRASVRTYFSVPEQETDLERDHELVPEQETDLKRISEHGPKRRTLFSVPEQETDLKRILEHRPKSASNFYRGTQE
ncbi:CLUMA_CG006421, isoform A [Clunio marinus]|uniref:CLUMA_CG006421, isoform A n=1 Tax=Clunio marinus TaxID=568069 RepID=A0A1J1HXG1_9DIPT|nr:CLUMA_CG006421, isoform A [Clunio marinus]